MLSGASRQDGYTMIDYEQSEICPDKGQATLTGAIVPVRLAKNHHIRDSRLFDNDDQDKV